ncbi:hypothetical protein F2Q69_00011084 [Brassica cretica]|uniref:Uncharacterized protein n=1 Tax=Brassica cretica TaxID=69181 RepID=A0A8S9QVW8_BRACR|nr:hypothetical protein F2Q69_00011084 [Brassica cretica]
MGKKGREESSSVETTWDPQTSIIKPIAPIYPDQNQTDERRFVGLDHLSFGDLLALANTKSPVFFSGQTGLDKELIIKTPKKPKSKKHRPKTDPRPKTPKKPVVEGEEIKTDKREYVRKKQEVDEYQEYTPVKESAAGGASTHAKKACRRSLVFEDEEGDIQHRDETGSANIEKQNKDLQDCDIAVRKRKRSQSRSMGKELKNNEAQARKIRQRKEPIICSRFIRHVKDSSRKGGESTPNDLMHNLE